jgi:hypothetical protein
VLITDSTFKDFLMVSVTKVGFYNGWSLHLRFNSGVFLKEGFFGNNNFSKNGDFFGKFGSFGNYEFFEKCEFFGKYHILKNGRFLRAAVDEFWKIYIFARLEKLAFLKM